MSYWDQEETGGGGLDGMTGIITNAYFKEGDYGWSLYLETTFDDPENYPKFEGGTIGRHFSIGKQFMSKDNGETSIHESGDESKAYNALSGIRTLMRQLGSLEGVREAYPDLNPHIAKSFVGLHLEWANVPIKKQKRNPETDQWEDVPGNTELLPVRLLGGAATAEALDISSLGLTTDQHAALAGAATDDAFMKVLLESGLTSNPRVMGLVSKDLKGFRAALAF
jgi:hypothetical protein